MISSRASILKYMRTFFLTTFVLISAQLFSEIADIRIQLPEAGTLSFTPKEKKLIAGTATEKGNSPSCRGVFPENEIQGGFTAASTFYQNGCYTDCVYSACGFLFTEIEFQSPAGQIFPAIQVSPPQKKAEKFLASHHFLYYKFPAGSDYNVYVRERAGIKKIASVSANEIRDGFTRIPNADLSVLGSPSVYIVVPARENISPLSHLNKITEGAWISDNNIGTVGKILINASGRPFDTRKDFSGGPADWSNVYGTGREFFFLKLSPEKNGILWQNKDGGNIILTVLNSEMTGLGEKVIGRYPGEKLVAAADGGGKIFAVYAKTGKALSSEYSMITLRRYSAEGIMEKSTKPSTSPRDLNVFSIADSIAISGNVADLKFSSPASGGRGVLLLMLSRSMHKSPDGLNHQGAIAVHFDPESLNVLKNYGQTSGHSFGNFSIPLGNESFAAVDLGDNYPRGIHLHVFGGGQRDSRVLFTFKTQHGTTAKSPAGKVYPLFPEISSGTKKFYRWSNDNHTYAEVGGVAKTEKGMIVLFATETPILDNGRVGSAHNDPRNIFIVHAKYPFPAKATPWNVVDEDLVLSDGKTVSGKFYDFGGGESLQQNAGAKQITNYNSMEVNASRPRIVRTDEDRYFIAWEEWAGSHYLDTKAAIIDQSGNLIRGPESMGDAIRIGRQDDIIFYNGYILFPAGSAVEKKLELGILKLH